MDNNEKHVLCDECAAGVCNDDWSHLDDGRYDTREDADAAHASAHASLESLGWLSHVGEADMPGYFHCAVCDEIQCGGGEIFCAM